MSWLERLEQKDLRITRADGSFVEVTSTSVFPYMRNAEGLDSNVLMAPLLWLTRNFTEAEPVVERRRGRLWEVVDDHPLTALLRRPNPFYSGRTLWKASVLSFGIDGNAYWQKVRNGFGEVLGYWYLPHFLVEPRFPADGSVFISHYDYNVPGRPIPIRLEVRDVVHFRYEGLDPRNPRKGISPLKILLREVCTDDEAARFSAAILRNMGVPGGIIAPKDANALPTQEDVKGMKEFMQTGFSGERRGEWLVLGAPTEVAQFGFDPNRLMLTNLRDVSEERVCALLGIPAAVVGFGAGLQQTKVGATMRELRQSAWHNCVIPMQNDLGDQVTFQVVPDFTSQPSRLRVTFDRSMVSAFEEEAGARSERIRGDVLSGVLRVDHGQELLGYAPDPSQAVYLRPTNVAPVAVGDPGLAPAPKAEGGAPADPPADPADDPPADTDTDTKLLKLIAARVGANAQNGRHLEDEE